MQNDTVVKDKTFDSNIAGFIKDPYRFLSRKLDQYDTEALETHLLFLKPAVILRGEEGARLFYDKDKFTRKRVMPGHIKKPLFGRGSIHGTDHLQHEERKKLFLDILGPEHMPSFQRILEGKLYEQMEKWTKAESLILLDEVSEILCRAICEWCGIYIPESKVKIFTKYNREMVESIGQVGPRHWYGRYARVKSELWMADLIKKTRNKEIKSNRESPVYKIAMYREDGKLLSLRQASVTLLNIIRPCIAAARFVVFGALALHERPEMKERLQEDYFQEWFAQEVRRYYPFVPGMLAKARKGFTWGNYTFKKGTFAILDIYGTNHDPSIWKNPEEFNPERFREWNGSAYNFIPQGGGIHEVNHRCPGEWMTIALLKKSMWFLSQVLEYEVPPQDLHIEFNKIITQPKSGFIINKVKLRIT
jgi:fatty-acid peroxygenase